MTLVCGVVLGGGTVTVTEQFFAPAPSATAATSVSGIINSYQAVSAVSGKTVTVIGSVTGAGTAFKVGDEVMLIQMTGVSPAVSGSNFGNYERTTITAISGSTITLAAVTKGYSPTSEKVQLVRVYSDTGTTTVTGDVKAKAWDGTTGGVIAMSGETLSLNANIDASGTGFTTTNAPTKQVVAPLSNGQGQTSGRGSSGAAFYGYGDLDYYTRYEWDAKAGGGGGGIDGGGGAAAVASRGGAGGGVAGGAQGGATTGGSVPQAAGVDGGKATVTPPGTAIEQLKSGAGAAGGGGGVVGGGGGGGANGSGGGGGVDGGGSGASLAFNIKYNGSVVATYPTAGGGGGGVRSVGNGGDGLPGGASGTLTYDSMNEGSGGGGGGSYGGGGGVSSNVPGGDDGGGAGGGGSWFGGGAGSPGGGGTPTNGARYPAGGNGNAAVGTPIPDSRHYLNAANPRLMMGGAGGRGSSETGSTLGGAGGGIVVVEYDAITTASGKQIRSNGAAGTTPPGGGAHSGSGGGAGGQMKITATTLTTQLALVAAGGVGGKPTANVYHGGVPGGGGGGGGVWLETSNVTTSCPATTVPNASIDISGGAGGSRITNPKNSYLTGGAGTGGAGLPCASRIQLPPSLSTTATDKADGDHLLAQSGGVVRDTLTYANLTPNVTYTAKGTLWDKATAKATTITASKTFTASSTGSGSVDVEFTVPAGFAGSSLVAFETVFDAGNTAVVSHEDLADAAQTVSVADLATVATDKADGDHTMTGAGGVISDVLTYTNLVPNASYTVNGTLWDKATTSATSITATKTFTASSTGSGSVTMEFTVPSGYGGKTLVAYERVLSGATVVASHESIGDSNQTVTLQAKPLIVNKVDETGRLIGGATFQVCKEVVASIVCTGLPGFTATAEGVFSINALDPGTYQLTETKAPDGFTALADPVRFTVAADGSIALLSSSQDVSLSDQTITVRDHAIPMDVVKVGSDGGTVVPLKGAAFLVFPFSGYDNQAHVVVPDDLAPAAGVWYKVNPADLAAYQRVQSAHPSWSIAFTSDASVPSGTVRLAGLAPMTVYALVEMVAPTGHALLAEPVVFAVDTGRVVRIAVESFHPEATATGNTMTITDQRSIILPFTGVNAAWQYSLFGGMVLLLGAVVSLLLRWRNRRHQSEAANAAR